MPGALLAVVFVVAAAVSLAAGWQLVIRIERLGAHWGMTEALLGLLAALAADAPEITTAVTALARGSARIGAGVVLGSNVFNLAALLGLGALVAGRIALHRRVVALEGIVATWTAIAALLVVLGILSPLLGLLVALLALIPYAVVLSRATALPETALVASASDGSSTRDGLAAILLTLVVVGASIVMERSASTLGARHAVPGIVLGGLVLAAVTSLPNAVAAVYLARRGRGAATLSTAMNSNAVNVIAGLLIPGAIAGLGHPSGSATYVAAGYLGLTVVVLTLAHARRGLGRRTGAAIIALYLAFAVVLVVSA